MRTGEYFTPMGTFKGGASLAICILAAWVTYVDPAGSYETGKQFWGISHPYLLEVITPAEATLHASIIAFALLGVAAIGMPIVWALMTADYPPKANREPPYPDTAIIELIAAAILGVGICYLIADYGGSLLNERSPGFGTLISVGIAMTVVGVYGYFGRHISVMWLLMGMGCFIVIYFVIAVLRGRGK